MWRCFSQYLECSLKRTTFCCGSVESRCCFGKDNIGVDDENDDDNDKRDESALTLMISGGTVGRPPALEILAKFRACLPTTMTSMLMLLVSLAASGFS
ncbi:hypothetical protein PoB_000542800 [Plakobranchus ocellatus]|uniref:Uncharacterized protein n=1 Tax=Plakobranchus ocellatus TaxID=259542 RepID=A0AAV3Y9U7_9GAST|nr:hypothetical protein PoB_000542800 [Plakobranchus ocellatus]